MAGLDFFFEGHVVGVLADTDGPRVPGRYGYMPYRGGGHYLMQTSLRSGGSPRCACQTEQENVEFTVRSCPEYGVLEIDEIQRTPQRPR